MASLGSDGGTTRDEVVAELRALHGRYLAAKRRLLAAKICINGAGALVLLVFAPVGPATTDGMGTVAWILAVGGAVIVTFVAVALRFRWRLNADTNGLCRQFGIPRQALYEIARSDPDVGEDLRFLRLIDFARASALAKQRKQEKRARRQQ